MSSPPTTLGKYQIIREIARSNDIVYEAYDPLMDRRVALKELNVPAGSTSQQRDDRISRFERESRAAGRLAHPNIMTIYDFASEGDRYFMAMEYLDGTTLRNEIDTKGALPQEKALEIAKAILAGLEHAHQNGVVHRDIKPDNIQLTTHGVKITDFGIARLTFQPNLTIDGQVFGTPSYMSPEQVKGGEIDARSDVFSVGVVLYEMLTGEKPYQGDSVITITYAILNKEPDMPSSINYGLWRVIQRALDKSPQLRYASAKEMSTALDEALAQTDAGVFSTASQVSPSYNPYLPTQPGPPPIAYPYNPYVQSTSQPTSMPGFTPTPGFTPPNFQLYYPPPPRKPLLNAEQSAFAKRVLMISIVLGTFFGVVIMSILYFTGNLGNRSPLQDAEPGPAESVSTTVPPGATPDAKVVPRGTVSGAPDRSAALVFASEAFTSQHYGNEVKGQQRVDAMQKAGDLFEKAAESEPDTAQSLSYREKAALCFADVYSERKEMGLSGSELRESLPAAMRNARGTAVETDIRRMSDQESFGR